MLEDGILNWLDQLPASDIPQSIPCKRRRGPLTPEASNASRMSSRNSSPGKRDRNAADDATPRPNRKLSKFTPSLGSEHSRDSKASGRDSPQKQLRSLEFSAGGIRIQELETLQSPPAGLFEFLMTMEKLASRRGLLCPSMRPQFQNHPNFRIAAIGADEGFFSDDREEIGHVPSLELVQDLLDSAIECSENLHAEPGWNMEVHHHVLRLALRPPGRPSFSHQVNFMPCPTAALLPELCSSSLPSKKIDFCMYINPDNENSRRRRIRAENVNPTEYYALRSRPLALCIETKKPGEGWENATLQMGVWQAAQWIVLEATMAAAQELNLANRAAQAGEVEEASYDLPEFLPGIIIQGHDWFLVITTREDTQTVLWHKLMIGTTNSVAGIYQIIYGLQVLRKWCEAVYWPLIRNIVVES